MIKQLTGVPWNPRGKGAGKGQAAADCDEKPPDVVELPEEDEHQPCAPGEDGTELEFASRTNAEGRNFRLRRTDFAEHGFTDGCRGCASIQKGLTPVGHNAACHTRMAELLRVGSERDRRRVERAETRIAEAILRSAQDEIRRAGEQAGEELKKTAQELKEA